MAAPVSKKATGRATKYEDYEVMPVSNSHHLQNL